MISGERFLPFLGAALIALFSIGSVSLRGDSLPWHKEPGYRWAEINLQGTGSTGFSLIQGTGVAFTNTLAGDAYLTNAVAHNGSGVALGDVDGDGWVDIYFCNLQGSNQLYRNLGGWHFEPTEIGDAACPWQLSTGAAFADVDGDGDLDLLVNGIAAGTRLFLGDGEGHFTESPDSGLSRTASATSMTLADIDGDGDLDLYCTHYIDEMHLADPTVRFALKRRGNDYLIAAVNDQPTTSPRLTNRFQVFGNGRVRELPEVHGLYRNDGKGHFTAIEFEPGVFMDTAGKPIPPYRDWGLAAMFRDLNGDGVPDLYVCNDNASPDRMWLNTGQGKFRAFEPLAFRHTSRSSMGLDIADINRDGYDDIFTADMLAHDHQKRMMQLVKDHSDPQLRENVEEQPRYNRNALFLGRADGTFAEAALMAGVAASDWSWCPIFVDVDLDGFEDLLVTTGFSFDVMDQDSHDRIRKGRLPADQLKRSRQFHPKWPTPKAVFRNRGDGTFERTTSWGLQEPNISNGAALADLDNDGDLDLVINNLNEAASLYRNDAPGARIAVRLSGVTPNTGGVGARIEVTGGSVAQSQEMISGGRYMSGDQAMRVFAASSNAMRIEVRWRNGERSILTNVAGNRTYEIEQRGAAPRTGETDLPKRKPALHFRDASELLNHVHVEDAYDDWARQALLPHRLSRLGPAACWFDFDGDGWEDLAISAARGGKLALFRNEAGKGFRQISGFAASPADQIATTGLGNRRFVVAVSNLERGVEAQSELQIYEGTTLTNTLPLGKASPGTIAIADIDGDGDLDLFVGARFAPGRYPEPVESSIWTNDKGAFHARPDLLATLGMATGATFTDFDGDGSPDLALATGWGPIRLFRNEKGKFTDITEGTGLASWTGLWTSVATGDFDGDGRLDLVAGNFGRNTAYELHQPASLRLYYGDWNTDGMVDLMESFQQGTDFYPVRDRTKLSAFLPDLGTWFPTHAAFGRATIAQILGERLPGSHFVEAAHLESVVFLNRGSRFQAVPLPREAQLTPVTSVSVADFDGDGTEDLFLSQNIYGVLTDLTRDDNGRGLWLRGRGDGTFSPIDSDASGIKIPGEQRAAAAADFNHDGRTDLVVTQNSGATRLFINERARPGLRIILQGPPENPLAIGSQIQVIYSGGRSGPNRWVGSQNGPAQILGLAETPAALRVRFANGQETLLDVPAGASEMQVRIDLSRN